MNELPMRNKLRGETLSRLCLGFIAARFQELLNSLFLPIVNNAHAAIRNELPLRNELCGETLSSLCLGFIVAHSQELLNSLFLPIVNNAHAAIRNELPLRNELCGETLSRLCLGFIVAHFQELLNPLFLPIGQGALQSTFNDRLQTAGLHVVMERLLGHSKQSGRCGDRQQTFLDSGQGHGPPLQEVPVRGRHVLWKPEEAL